MPLTRKTRVSGSSIVVTIPSQIAEAFNISSGDFFEIIPVKNGEIRIKKIETDHPYEDNDLKEKI
ncbi:MAG: AbrB/MazE/SpoVT family DNA-binding domain-containing protein [Thermoplasmatales archaeon]|nr:AbrB/MazE/SpoVT family DNA-binding domain-containing protein [Thermoplasmatales archaeon]MCK4995473.1 AbrB/MazE/SpoVT family DNA-binding domain-containing protein [Thermoplasmatales archaeon]